MTRRRFAVVLALAVLWSALGSATAPAQPDRVIVAFGDSLTAGLGVSPPRGYPALLDAQLRTEGYSYRVVNAGVSGDTTAGGLRRVDWALRHKPDDRARSSSAPTTPSAARISTACARTSTRS